MAEKKGKEGRKAKKYVAKSSCPKCGPGAHLAEHKNRRTCGKCGYTEMLSPSAA